MIGVGRLDDEAPDPVVVQPPAVRGTVRAVSPFWLWTQVLVVIFVVIGMVIAVTKLV